MSVGGGIMQQRYYDPAIGTFLSVDPVTAYTNPIGQFHRYRYANNNPLKFTDPDGRQALDHSAKFLDLNKRHGGDTDSMLREMADGQSAGLLTAGGVVLLAVPDPTDVVIGGLYARFLAARTFLNAYKIAAEGGRHAGLLRQLSKQTRRQIEKSIRSIEKRINEHLDKIRNPEKHMTRDDASNSQNVAQARKDWAQDISRQQQQRDIAKEELRQRGTSCTGSRIPGNC